jgi:hypothetical protein
VAGITDMLGTMGIQVLVYGSCPVDVRPEGLGTSRWAGVGGGMRTAIRKAGLQDEWFSCICRESISQGIDLLIQLRHRPGVHHLLQNPHVSRKVFASISVKLGIW